jgi:hypothetical protein
LSGRIDRRRFAVGGGGHAVAWCGVGNAVAVVVDAGGARHRGAGASAGDQADLLLGRVVGKRCRRQVDDAVEVRVDAREVRELARNSADSNRRVRRPGDGRVVRIRNAALHDLGALQRSVGVGLAGERDVEVEPAEHEAIWSGGDSGLHRKLEQRVGPVARDVCLARPFDDPKLNALGAGKRGGETQCGRCGEDLGFHEQASI